MDFVNIYEYGVEGYGRPPRGSSSTPRASRGAARAGVRQPRRCSEPPCPPACPDAAVTRSDERILQDTTSCTQCFPVVRSRPAHRPRPCCSRALSRPPTPSSWQVRRDVKGLCRTSAGARCHSVSIWGCASLDELGLCGVFRLGQSLGSSVQGTFAARQASAPQRLPSPRSRARPSDAVIEALHRLAPTRRKGRLLSNKGGRSRSWLCTLSCSLFS